MENNAHVLPPDVKEALESIAKKEGYITFNISLRHGDKEGQGYMGDTFPVLIKGKTADGDKETYIFVKTAVMTEYLKTYAYAEMFFEAEGYYYSELSFVLSKMQEDANIPIKERYNLIKGYEESNKDSVFMEDVTVKGFKPCDRMAVPSLEYVELTTQQLARFHGLSYVMQKKNPVYFKEKLMWRVNPLKLNDVWNAIATNTSYMSCQDLNEETKSRAEAYVPTVAEKYKFHIEDRPPHSCLCHGDFRMLNIMKKEENGKVVDVLPIDYQNFCMGCPFTDYFYFLYGCTDREMRKNHLNRFRDLYYDSLDKFLKYFGMTAEEIYTRKVYEETFKSKLEFGFVSSLIFYPFFFAPKDNAPDWSKDSLATIKYTLDKPIQDRIQELVYEFIELGIL